MKAQLIKNLKTLEETLFFLTILFLPTQLGKHFWPEFSFIYSLRIDYLSPTVYFWDLLILALITTAFLSHSLNVKKLEVNKLFLCLGIGLMLAQSLSLVNAINPEAGIVRLKELMIAGLFGLYVSSQKFSEISKSVFRGLLIAVIFECLLAITQFLIGRSVGLWILGERTFFVTTPLIAKFNFYDQVFLRPYGTFSHPNLLAAFLVLSLPLIINSLSSSLNRLRFSTGLLVAGTVFITFSRPALVLIAIQIGLLLKKYWRWLLVLFVITAPLAFVRFASIFTFDDLALLRRQELSEYALYLFGKNPLLGGGINNFINYLALDRVLVGTSRFLQPCHNAVLLILAETGIVGFLGWLAIFGLAIIKSFKSRTAFSKVLIGNLLMIIFLGFFDHYFLTLPQGQRMLFLILGLSFRRST